MDSTLFAQKHMVKLNSVEYRARLTELTKSIKRHARTAVNETDVVQEFYFILKRAIVDDFGVETIDFKPEVNSKVLGFKFTGRMDAVSNNLVLEYKHHSNLDTNQKKKEAHNQVVEYLEQLFEEEQKQYKAILTDGIKIKYFYFFDNKVQSSNFTDFDEDDMKIMLSAILNYDSKKFLPENIVRDFSLSASNSITAELANSLFSTLTKNKKIDEDAHLLYEEWKVLFNLSEHDNGKSEDINKRRRELGNLFGTEIKDNDTDFKSLFALQTTYAIIVKLIASKIVTFKQYGESLNYFEDLTNVDDSMLKDFAIKLENGLDYQNEGYINLLEGDFFSWYVIEDMWNPNIARALKKVIKTIADYSYIRFKDEYEPIDIFKDLYMEVMPNAVRHSLGEYFTPSWLADRVVETSISQVGKEDWKAIDPTCGSGVFITTLIKKIIEKYQISNMDIEEKNALINQITHRVLGIDMNPISVLTARVSYFLSIMPLVSEDTSFEIPVYLGNSAIIGETVTMDGVECYSVTTSSLEGFSTITLPKEFVDNKNFLKKMNHLNKLSSVLEKEKWQEKLLDEMSDECKNALIEREVENLAEHLYLLQGKGLNKSWIRIITNQLLIASIRDVDVIVGNPPWVKWEHLPQTYAQTIKEQCVDRHLFSGQTYMGAISLNICALISNVTAGRWLTKDGILAFLMPKTLLTQDSYAGFRNFYIDYETNTRLYLQKIEDWTKAGSPFIYTTEKFATYYYKYDYKDYRNEGVEVSYVQKKRGERIDLINKYHTYEEVSGYFNIEEGIAYQLDETRTGLTVFEGTADDVSSFRNIIGDCDYKARSGVEFTPYEIYTFEAHSTSDDTSVCRFKNFSSASTVHKASNLNVNGIKLETKFIKPIVKGSKIEPFKINFENEYGVFPYSPRDAKIIEMTELEKLSPKLLNYLIDYKDLIGKQSDRSKLIARGKEFYSLSKIGVYTFANHLVTFRDNSKMAAAVVTPVKTHWGEDVLPVCAKHAPYISMDKDGNFISEDEAYYISAILNSKIVGEYFKFTYSSRSYSINFNIKIPKFNPENELHLGLVELSKLAHTVNSKMQIKQIQSQIDDVYLKICEPVSESHQL